MQRIAAGVLLLNQAGQITFANAAAIALLNLPENYIGQVLGQQQFINPQGEPLPLEHLPVQRALASHQACIGTVLGLHIANQAVPRWIRLDVEPQMNTASASVSQLVCTCSEVAGFLDQAPSLGNEALLAYMGHELRSPLNAILGFTQLMQRDTTMAHSHLELLQIIERSGEQLLSLIGDLVELGKIQAGQVGLSHTAIHLPNLLSTLEQMLRHKAKAQGLSCSFCAATAVPTHITADESKLRQSLLSLLGCIIKLSQAEPIQIEVQTVTAATQTVLRLEVSSSATNALRVRSQLSGAAGAASSESWSLQLTISRQLIKALGGTLQIGISGSLIVAYEVPIRLMEINHRTPQPQTQDPIVGLAPGQPAYQILVVDDDPVSRLLMARLLGELGFQVKQAINGRQALQMWQQQPPHLICMDMQMPQMNGYEATQRIRAQAPSLPILVMTANRPTPEQLRAAQWDDFVPKPIRRHVLLEKLQQHLGLAYQYESTLLAESAAAPLGLPVAMLQQMPDAWLQALYQAAVQGSDRLVYDLAQQIPAPCEALSQALIALADEFQFEQILQDLQQTSVEVV